MVKYMLVNCVCALNYKNKWNVIMNNTDIKVSVIMPIYNAYDYLRPAIDSVLDQSLKEIELICIDDGSTDSSFELIKEYQKQDERIRIVTETNAGPALARNNGIKRARGEYLAFLDADDFFEPDLLEQLYNAAKERDLDIAISDYDIYNSRKAMFEHAQPSEREDIFTEGGVTSKNEHPDHIFMSTNGAAWNKLFRRSFVIDKELWFLPEVKINEDVYFVMSAMSLAERVGKVFKVLVHHRIYSGQSRAKQFKKYYTQVLFVYLKIKEFLMHKGMYAPLSSSFLNISASRCYKIYNILGSDAKENFWDLLHCEYAEGLGWHGNEAEAFDEEEVCEFCANIELYTHKQYKKRLAKGHRLDLGRLGTTFKNAKRRKKLRSFFAALSIRKKKKEEK